ncbi:hypothetical protein EGR_10749 [Echinococcus granulosus]|uniref:Uncharacterized protein n=1 Tax=Echinococcus granulosus TaxID=6210 RepID=W6U7P2_ECHGR|nr:hypothetical protein EGR_10749 [Echinococcus granulosus]EUB54392.1 hypothetical protein EGR_10749 [Echinococcus granulosus]
MSTWIIQSTAHSYIPVLESNGLYTESKRYSKILVLKEGKKKREKEERRGRKAFLFRIIFDYLAKKLNGY